ncbi:MAG TPA: AAA family ATPase [Gemmataceae bacterium]|jgi:predicted ATPase
MATVPENEVVAESDERTKPPFLRRVRIRGYKSIAFCDVALQPLTVLVGRNASGKSNFIDALAFLRDVMESGVSDAVKRRDGWSSIHCRTAESPSICFEIEAGFTCGQSSQRMTGDASIAGKLFTARYDLELADDVGTAPPIIVKESLDVFDETGGLGAGFEVQGGNVWKWKSEPDTIQPLNHPSSLLGLIRPDYPLLSAIGAQPFLDVANGLRWMGCYNFHPDTIRRLQKPNPGRLLERDGSNLASVIETTRENEEEAIERVGRYLSVITESVELAEVAKYGEYETVRFRIARDARSQPLEFDAASMSDGTLRTLAALVAAFQIVLPHGYPSLVAIEEPETSLHPAAMRALVDALDEATGRTQILLTTHSAELLDNPQVRPENVRVVDMIDGQTVITPVDEASVEIVRRKLNTLGGLERENQLEPDLDDLERQQRLGQSRQESPS